MPRSPGEVPDSLLRVMLADGIGPRSAVLLRCEFGDWDAVCGAPAEALGRVLQGAGLPRRAGTTIKRQLEAADPDGERREMERHGVSLVLEGDDDYPALLRLSPDPPPALYLRGELRPEDAWAIAIVGSRTPTPYGLDLAGRISADLAGRGLTIVSGGARGIDAASHRGAMRSRGRTIAVMGCGLGVVYPPEHGDLYEQLLSCGGAIVSEFGMRTEVRPGQFPRRNRVIAGLALAV
ncbi:MAG: DNA-processing protein DprA, partial [Phycisphaerae bacterium]|nr:DNA-processing protein DprA [Phycisphaerae bacterium]